MKLAIHIGLPKTGSTFIQTTLLANAATLAEAGICYPTAHRDKIGNHYAWEDAFASDPAAAAAALRAEAKGHGADTVLISAESFVLFFAFKPGGAEALRALTSQFEVEIVLMLRRQDDFLESYYAQSMRAGAAERIEAFAERPIFDFEGVVARILGADPAVKLRLAPFAPSREDPMASLEPLCAAVGLDRARLSPAPQARANTRSHRRMTLFLAELDKSHIAGVGRILRALDAADPIADDGGKCLSSTAFRRAFFERHLEANRRLCAAHGDAALAQALCMWRDADPGWAAPAPITPEERARAMRIVTRVSRQRKALVAARSWLGAALKPFSRSK